jgi:hypothetical protein
MAKRIPDMLWTLGRLGQRVPLYGPLNMLVPAEAAQRWLEALLGIAEPPTAAASTVMLLARRTDDRHRDIAEDLRERVVPWLEANSAPEHFGQLVKTGGTLDHEEQGLVFGESLPSGLRIG